MTVIHIACIGAVTICAMMAHAAMLAHEASVKRLETEERNQRNQRNQQLADARNQEWQAAQLALEIEKQQQHAALQIEAERNRLRDAARAQRRSATAGLVAPQPKRNQVIVDGISYPSIQAAANAHGITRQAMSKKINKETT